MASCHDKDVPWLDAELGLPLPAHDRDPNVLLRVKPVPSMVGKGMVLDEHDRSRRPDGDVSTP